MRNLTLCLFLFVLAKNLNASDSLKLKKEWAGIGFGASINNFRNPRSLFNFSFNYNCPFKKVFWQAGFNGDVLTSTPNLNAVNFNFGFRKQSRFLFTSGSAGPAIMWGYSSSNNRDNENELKPFTAAGISSSIQIILRPKKDIGAGVELFSNLNKFKSNFGCRLVLCILSGG